MLETYKNILANKFMRDTNYIIIKDTDDIEELQREWDLFQTQMTKKQQEKSDERSIEIWRMTNQEHYETLRDSLIDEFEQTYSTNDDTLEQQDDYEEEEKPEEDDTPKNLVNTSLDDLEIPDDENDITEAGVYIDNYYYTCQDNSSIRAIVTQTDASGLVSDNLSAVVHVDYYTTK